MGVIDYLQRRDGARFELGKYATPHTWEETRSRYDPRSSPPGPSAVVRLTAWSSHGFEWFRFSSAEAVAGDLREKLTDASYTEAQILEVARRIMTFAGGDLVKLTRDIDGCSSDDEDDDHPIVASRYFGDDVDAEGAEHRGPDCQHPCCQGARGWATE